MSMNKTVFQSNPTRLDISRSKFDLSHDWTGTFNTGLAIPVLFEEVLPGDTFSLDCSMVIRSTTPIAPVMDNAYADVYFFFVPNKLTLGRQMMSPSVNDKNHSWSAIMGAQDSLLNMPLPDNSASVPTVGITGGFDNDTFQDIPGQLGSLADYMGLPLPQNLADVDMTRLKINAVEPLAYYCVWNNYFREPNTMNPVTFSIYNKGVYLDGGPDNFAISEIGGVNSVLPVCRPHGYFGSCLPWPQRNSEAVTLPLGELAPVVGVQQEMHDAGILEAFVNGTTPATNKAVGVSTSGEINAFNNGVSGDQSVISDWNLYADLRQAQGTSVSQLRQAIQVQRWYEAAARGGNSLSDLTAAMFGVTPSFAHADRPEYLGGKRIPIQIEQVNNTSSVAVSSAGSLSLGSTGAYSLTYGAGSMFTKSFDTWGTIVGIVCVRTAESFHQGLARKYSRKTKFDYYWPQFANLGEQVVLSKEIFMDGTSGDDQVFGYQEAWAEYRYETDHKTGYCRPGSNAGYWTYCNDFATRPTLAGYLDARGQIDNVDNTLQVSSAVAGFQWMANINFNIKAVRPMPTYSIPGLMDHH